MWRGHIAFGLVSIPVGARPATEDRGVSFHQYHRADGGRIRYKKVCEIDDEAVAAGDIAKGIEVPGGEVVLIEPEDLDHLPLPTAHTIDVIGFAPAEQIDPIMYAKAYWLEPDRQSKPYALLRDALSSTERVAITKVAFRTREQLATLRVVDGALVLHTMHWPDEIRPAKVTVDDGGVRRQEMQMARSLIETMGIDFEPADYSDEYRAAMEELVEAKIAGREVVETAGETGQVVDLSEALRASMERLKPVKKTAGKKAAKRAPRKSA